MTKSKFARPKAANDNDSGAVHHKKASQLAFDFDAPAGPIAVGAHEYVAPPSPVAPPPGIVAALAVAATAQPKRPARRKAAARPAAAPKPVEAVVPTSSAETAAPERAPPRQVRRAIQSLAPCSAEESAELVKELMARIYAAAVSSFDAAEIDPSERMSGKLAKDGAALANALARLGVTLARLEDLLAKRSRAA